MNNVLYVPKRLEEIRKAPKKVQILGDCIDLTRPMRNTMCPAMNQTQLRIAKQICKEHGVSFHQSITDLS